MKPSSFQYHAPKTIAEAVELLAQFASDDGRVLAGGQSLIPTMALRMAKPSHLIDINDVSELDHIAIVDGKLSIGACVRHSAFHRSVVDGPLGKLLSFVAKHIAHYAIRTRGTFCGSLANADPSSEWALTAVTLGATIIARNTRGVRELEADDFFDSIMTTHLADDELLVEVRFPLMPDNVLFGFYEFSRRPGDYAVAMSLVTFAMIDGAMADVRIGIGGAEARPRRIESAERAMIGMAPSPKVFAAAADAAAAAIDPLEDLQADKQYRRDLVRAVVSRALERAAAQYHIL